MSLVTKYTDFPLNFARICEYAYSEKNSSNLQN